MLTKKNIVDKILENKSRIPQQPQAQAFAPSNIALVKYWGKRDIELNLPITSSLSVSLKEKGTTTKLCISDKDTLSLNNQPIDLTQPFAQKVLRYLDLFRDEKTKLHIETTSNIPIAAGLASSASGFAALILTLNELFQWHLSRTELSVLARLGSGSACRSLWDGFVEWKMGVDQQGFDSFGHSIKDTWPTLCIGLVMISEKPKAISSREAMAITVKTSQLYSAWPKQVADDLKKIKMAIAEQNFTLLGSTAEHNALSMHATMMASQPAIVYSQPETLQTMSTIWHARAQGLPLYFTQDAGPNVKLLFLENDSQQVQKIFPDIEIISLF